MLNWLRSVLSDFFRERTGEAKNIKVTTKTALQKLKHYWLNNSGTDYLEKLMELRKDIPTTHKSSSALDIELAAVSKAHKQFIVWTKTKTARAQLDKCTHA